MSVSQMVCCQNVCTSDLLEAEITSRHAADNWSENDQYTRQWRKFNVGCSSLV